MESVNATESGSEYSENRKRKLIKSNAEKLKLDASGQRWEVSSQKRKSKTKLENRKKKAEI
jgi:hypothetical protein